MAFNANTYHANKSRKEALGWIEKARDIKVRDACGEAYDWEVKRLPAIISYARFAQHRSLSFRRLRALEV